MFLIGHHIPEVVQIEYAHTQESQPDCGQYRMPIQCFCIEEHAAQNTQQTKKQKYVKVAQSSIPIRFGSHGIFDGGPNAHGAQQEKNTDVGQILQSKCAVNQKNEIIDFSRKYKKKYNYKCVGLFAFKKDVLSKYDKLNKSKKELIMKVEQFKLLENNIKINSLSIDHIQNSINSKKDLEA